MTPGLAIHPDNRRVVDLLTRALLRDRGTAQALHTLIREIWRAREPLPDETMRQIEEWFAARERSDRTDRVQLGRAFVWAGDWAAAADQERT